MVWTPVTYCLSKRLLAYTATVTGTRELLTQARRTSVRLVATSVLNAGMFRQEPLAWESALQRPGPR